MKKYISILKNTQLFAGVDDNEILSMLDCLQGKLSTYKKGSFVFQQGDTLEQLAILVEGKLHIQREDYWGNRTIINMIDVSEMFGESYASPKSGPMGNDVVAIEDSTVMFFDLKKILTICPSACPFHSHVIQNLLFAISEKNRNLVQKLGHMSKRSTREKLMSYLSDEAKKQNNNTITIPFNRQQLADFLSVDRSALSRELCKMREDGLIIFHKNNFTLL